MKSRVQELPDGYQRITRGPDDTTFDSCFECGNEIYVGGKVFFESKDDGCPLCSLECAAARREQLAATSA